MARFIIRFYSADNTQCEELVVTGRKLSEKEVSQIDGEHVPGKEMYYISKKNAFSIKWIVRYNGVLDFASYKSPKYHYCKIVEV